MNKTILIILGALILGGGLVLWSYNSSKAPQAAPGLVTSGAGAAVLTATDTSFNFGEVSMAKGLVEHKFTLKNNSNQAVRIGRVETSCMCTTAFLMMNGREVGPFGMSGHGGPAGSANLMVNPGEEVFVRAVFDPAAHGPAGVGTVERQIMMDVGGSPMYLDFKAVVKP